VTTVEQQWFPDPTLRRIIVVLGHEWSSIGSAIDRGNEFVTKPTDQDVLKSYCVFAGMHRAIVAQTLIASLTTDPNQRRSTGLELAANFVAALEDVALWYFVLKEWESGEALFDLIHRIQIRDQEGYKYSTQEAVAALSDWTIADLRREFGLPSDEELIKRGWNEEGLTSYINGLREALVRLKSGLELRLEDEGILRTSYNRIKHGALAFPTTENSEIGVSVMILSRRAPGRPGGKVNQGWISCDDDALRRLASNAVIVSEALWALLNLIYAYRFDRTWKLPRWPVPNPL